MKKIILLIIEKIRKALKVDEKGNSFGWGKGTLLLATLIMVGCGTGESVKYKVTDAYVIVEIDSCEYVRYNPSYGFQHKGNCRFCKERRQEELEELIEQLKEK